MKPHTRLYSLFLEDFTLIGITILLSIAFLTSSISNDNGQWAFVYVNNLLSQKLSLNTPKLYTQGRMIIQVDAGKIRVLSSDCPEQICVHAGWISKKGQILVCAPNHVLIEIPHAP